MSRSDGALRTERPALESSSISRSARLIDDLRTEAGLSRVATLCFYTPSRLLIAQSAFRYHPRVLEGPAVDVSVIVPVYNGERLLARCLESLLAQRDVAVDVIVVDDGSADRSIEVASSYPVRVVACPHAGVSATRNAGLRVARAALIGFCDHDDEWRPTKAARQVAYLHEHPEVASVLCRQEIVLAPDVDPPSWLQPDEHGDIGGPLPMSGLFRAEALAAVGGFDEELAGNEDLDLLVRMRELGYQTAVLDDRLVARHVHDDNWSHGPGSYVPGLFEVLRRRAHRSRT